MITQGLLTEEMMPAGDGLWYGSKVTDTFNTSGNFYPEIGTTINEFALPKFKILMCISITKMHMNKENLMK